MTGRILIFMKMNLRRWETWAFLILFALLVLTAHSVHIPDGSEMRVLLYFEDKGESAERIEDRLLKEESTFLYETADSSDEVRDEVLKGNAECGFIFSDDLSKRLESGDMRESIEYVYSPFTLKGNVAKETVFAAVYTEYAPAKAREAEESLYDTAGISDRADEIYEWFLESDLLFSVKYLDESADSDAADASNRTDAAGAGRPNTWPVHGMCAAVLFAYLFFIAGAFIKGSKEKGGYLPGGGRTMAAYMISGALLPTALALALILLLEKRAGFIPEAAGLIIYVICAALICVFITHFMKRRESINGWCAAFLAVGLAGSPIFWNTLPYGIIIPSGMYVYIMSLLA